MFRSVSMVLSVIALVALTVAPSIGDEKKAGKKGVEIGTPAPNFTATGVDGKEYSLDNLKDAKTIVVCFTCNKCPVGVAYEDRFIDFAKEYGEKGVKFVAINVNTGESLDQMKVRAEEKGFNFPYAYDETGDACRAYGARVTPHIFVLNQKRDVAYIGSFDNDMKNPTKTYLADAVDAILAGKEVTVSKTREFGCGIKPAKPKK